MSDTISADSENYFALKEEYLKAVEEKKDVFIFGDIELVTNCAKYLLEYINNTYKYE